MITFSNPRLAADFPDWPMGGNKRGRCTFTVEYNPKRGYRFIRQTTGKPKATTFGGPAAIVDGSDGRTYLLQKAGMYDFISVYGSNLLCADPAAIGCDHTRWPKHTEYAELSMLIFQANCTAAPTE